MKKTIGFFPPLIYNTFCIKIPLKITSFEHSKIQKNIAMFIKLHKGLLRSTLTVNKELGT